MSKHLTEDQRKLIEDKKQGRRVAWFFAIFLGWIFATLVYGSITGEIKWFQDKRCWSDDCHIE